MMAIITLMMMVVFVVILGTYIVMRLVRPLSGRGSYKQTIGE
jgi:hypothetical protein